MSNNLAKIFKYDYELDLDFLKEKTIAIDLMPILYKYLYLGNMDTPRGPLRKGEIITSYLYQTLFYIKKLKNSCKDVIVCLDGTSNILKSNACEKRKLQRSKTLDQYRQKIEKNEMKREDWKRYNCAKYYVTPENLVKLKEILLSYGIKTLNISNIEAEALCAYLKKKDLVNYCYSNDKDITLFGVPCLIDLNLYTSGSIHFDPEKNYKNLNLEEDSAHRDLLYLAIASGTDYSPGIFGLGPKKALKFLKKDKANFSNDLSSKVPETIQILLHFNLEEVSMYSSEIAIALKELSNLKLNEKKFRSVLKELDFNDATVDEYLS